MLRFDITPMMLIRNTRKLIGYMKYELFERVFIEWRRKKGYSSFRGENF